MAQPKWVATERSKSLSGCYKVKVAAVNGVGAGRASDVAKFRIRVLISHRDVHSRP